MEPPSGATPGHRSAAFFVSVLASFCICSAQHFVMSERKRPRQPAAARSRDATVTKLLSVHDVALERLKSALVIFLFVPKILNDTIEAAAKSWKDKNQPGKAHPDACSCTTARLKALLESVNQAMTQDPPLLVAPDEAKEAFTKLVNAISNGGSESIVSDITLRITGSRAADQSPYEITLVSSAEGQMFRSALQAVQQPGSSGQNSRDQPAKCWEFRPYRPRKGALVRELQK